MKKYFNVNGVCRQNMHYMVDLTPKLKEIKSMIDARQYFTINRARQYGKTTTLRALADYLKDNYTVLSLDFQKLSASDFENESSFVNGLAREIVKRIHNLPDISDDIRQTFFKLADNKNCVKLAQIFDCISNWCASSPRPVVLIIDEVDTATNNQVFLDFLAQLRAAYLDNDFTPSFQSVILASVYDIRNIRMKIRADEDHKANSPWNIAARFRINMSFQAEEIAGMLQEYEENHHTGMNVKKIAESIFNRTSGYPYLVSGLCKYIDEEISGTEEFPDKSSSWTEKGLIEAEKLLVTENNPLFQSLTNKLEEYPALRSVLYELLFTGKPIQKFGWK